MLLSLDFDHDTYSWVRSQFTSQKDIGGMASKKPYTLIIHLRVKSLLQLSLIMTMFALFIPIEQWYYWPIPSFILNVVMLASLSM